MKRLLSLLFFLPAALWPWVTTIALADDEPLSEEARARIIEGIQRHTASLEAELKATKEANTAIGAGAASSAQHVNVLIGQLTGEHRENLAAQVETAKVQGIVDADRVTIAQLQKDKAKLMRLLFVIAALAAAAALHVIPAPLGWWRYAIAFGVGVAAYGLLFAIL